MDNVRSPDKKESVRSERFDLDSYGTDENDKMVRHAIEKGEPAGGDFARKERKGRR